MVEFFDEILHHIIWSLEVVLVMHDSQRLACDFLHCSIIALAVWAVPHLLAELFDRLLDRFSLQRVLPELEPLCVLDPIVFVEEDPAALLANGLEDIDDVLEVANVEDRQLKLNEPEMARAADQVLLAGLADTAFLAHAKSQIQGTSCLWYGHARFGSVHPALINFDPHLLDFAGRQETELNALDLLARLLWQVRLDVLVVRKSYALHFMNKDIILLLCNLIAIKC